jgi:hypothetical protein
MCPLPATFDYLLGAAVGPLNHHRFLFGSPLPIQPPPRLTPIPGRCDQSANTETLIARATGRHAALVRLLPAAADATPMVGTAPPTTVSHSHAPPVGHPVPWP